MSYGSHILGSVEKGGKLPVGHLGPVLVLPGLLMVKLEEEVGIEVVIDSRGHWVGGGVWVDVSKRCSLSLSLSLVDAGLAVDKSHEVRMGMMMMKSGGEEGWAIDINLQQWGGR